MLNCVDHCCGRRFNCVEDSPCKTAGHVPSTLFTQDPVAENLLSSFLRSTTVFKNAGDYGQATDTYHVSFNYTMLIYINKRVHYMDRSYNLRQDLAVLDWNDHVGREYTSTYFVVDACHPDRQGEGGGSSHSKADDLDILDELLRNYDRRALPSSHLGIATRVTCEIYIRSFGSINPSNM
ncbi:uncharacterized protein ISCGN_003284 [Ixodes scapularis]